MLATHVDSHDLVITCTCSSALQSFASAFFPKLATRQTAAQWGEHSPHHQHRIRTEHTNHSVTEAAFCLHIKDKQIFSELKKCVLFTYAKKLISRIFNCSVKLRLSRLSLKLLFNIACFQL